MSTRPPHRLPCPGTQRATVILLHGYSANPAVHGEDGAAFVTEHTDVVMPEAPGHGSRDDGRLAQIASLPAERRRERIVAIAREWAAELPAVAARCRREGAERIALVGISMGGFAALGCLANPCPFDAVAAVLAEPTLVDDTTLHPGRPPLLLGLAGRDTAVDPRPGRAFAERYRAELHEYPESEHFMRAEDWRDLWHHTAAFVRHHLAAPTT